MNRRRLENKVHRKLLELGWRVQRAESPPEIWERDRAYWEPEYLRRHGFRPGTIVDVGVAQGTPELYDAFPQAFLVLIEPLAEFEGHIQAVLRKRAGMHIAAAAGAAPGERDLRVESRYPERSSLFERHPREQTGDRQATRRVPVVTLDSLAAESEWPGPIGLKIDIEGAEMEFLEGAARTLPSCEFVIAEVSLLPRFARGYSFAEFIAKMDGFGFGVCDILGIGRAPTSDVAFVDALFTPLKSSDGA